MAAARHARPAEPQRRRSPVAPPPVRHIPGDTDALAVLLQDRSLASYVASRDPVSGSVYGVMLVVYALLPWWLGRRTG